MFGIPTLLISRGGYMPSHDELENIKTTHLKFRELFDSYYQIVGPVRACCPLHQAMFMAEANMAFNKFIKLMADAKSGINTMDYFFEEVSKLRMLLQDNIVEVSSMKALDKVIAESSVTPNIMTNTLRN
jgi:hypothetical protein